MKTDNDVEMNEEMKGVFLCDNETVIVYCIDFCPFTSATLLHCVVPQRHT